MEVCLSEVHPLQVLPHLLSDCGFPRLAMYCSHGPGQRAHFSGRLPLFRYVGLLYLEKTLEKKRVMGRRLRLKGPLHGSVWAGTQPKVHKQSLRQAYIRPHIRRSAITGASSDPYCKYDSPVLEWFTSSLFIAGVFAALPAGYTTR